jgi:hypothetical protein
MTTEYLLPCVCGRKLRVNTTQAGETVQCMCGTRLTVSNLRELSNLELAPSKTTGRKSRKRPWTKRQGWILLGAILAAAAIALLGFLDLTRPRLADLESLSLFQVWAIWQDLRRGPDRNFSPDELRFLESLGIRRFWKTALTGTAAAGIILMALAYAIPGPQSPRRLDPRGSVQPWS